MRAHLMNGTKNAFLLADVRGRAARVNPASSQIRAWARRYGFDQFLLLEDDDNATAYMRIWNCDGEEVGACGNGTRAAGRVLMDENDCDSVSIATASALLQAWDAADREVSVDMGEPRLAWSNIPLAREMDTVELTFSAEAEGVRIERPGAVNMGNPHAVFFLRELDGLPLAKLGREVEYDPLFPERTNVGFARIFDARHIQLRVWERGAGLTAACGTGACAALVAAHRRGLTERAAMIMTDGGSLHVEWRGSDDHVVLTGPVEFDGQADIEL